MYQIGATCHVMAVSRMIGCLVLWGIVLPTPNAMNVLTIQCSYKLIKRIMSTCHSKMEITAVRSQLLKHKRIMKK
jgi:hypothetical protein